MAAAGGTGLKSGKKGKVHFNGSKVLQIGNWSMMVKSSEDEFATSETDGWKTSRQGVLSSSGSFAYKLDSTGGEAIHDRIPFDDADGEGLEGDLILYVDDTHYYTVPAIVNFGVDVDIDNGNVVSGSADWKGTGPVVATGW